MTDGAAASPIRRQLVDGSAPAWTRPYLRLARSTGDRLLAAADPVLVVPRAPAVHAGAQVGAKVDFKLDPKIALWHAVLFFVGAFPCAGGCTWNDIVDRDLDAQWSARARDDPSGR